jgi:hypothetical protein
MTDYQRFKRTNLYRKSRKEIHTLKHIIAVEIFDSLDRDYYLWRYFKDSGEFLFEEKWYRPFFSRDPRRSVLIELL